MQFELKEVRENFGMTTKEFAKRVGISEPYYKQYEENGEIPCKYIYELWKSFDEEKKKFPVPHDFFHYTSLTLWVNMSYHRMREVDVAEKMGIRQTTVSKIVSEEPRPLYDLKEAFHAIFPVVLIPSVYDKKKEDWKHTR